MHETSLIKDMLAVAEKVRQENGSKAVTEMVVEISEFAGMDEEHFRFHFEQETKKTPWQDVKLEIQKRPYGLEARLVSVILSGNDNEKF
jgi:Zn finger protein HypA/HybF involved in hydrogenase expression